MTNHENGAGAHRPERTGTTPTPASGGQRTHGGASAIGGMIMARAWRDAAEHARAETEVRRAYRGRRADKAASVARVEGRA